MVKLLSAIILAILLTGCATYDLGFNKPTRYVEVQ